MAPVYRPMRLHRIGNVDPSEPLEPTEGEPLARSQPSTLPPVSGERPTDLASARARLALGQALLAAGEPAAREILEDAGTCFEELGDEASMIEVDAALRDAAESIEESPRSFHRRASDSEIPVATPVQNIKPPCT